MSTENVHGIVRSSGHYGKDWPSHHVLTQGASGGLSMAGWTDGNEGFPQQTFLGASIRSFSLNAGFGDTTSTLSVELINDEYNQSDKEPLGAGDDAYHAGIQDQFIPPVVGTPVYFKFGGNPATIEQAYRKTFDDTYPAYGTTLPASVVFPEVSSSLDSQPHTAYGPMSLKSSDPNTNKGVWIDKSMLWNKDTAWRGKDHFVFGGILQSYTQNRGPGGNPLYSVQVVDPREILTNAVVLLNNYQGSTFNNKNLFNLYGFLEYDPSDALKATLESSAIARSVLTKGVDAAGNVGYAGNDMYRFPAGIAAAFSPTQLPEYLPITGQGFSRRSDRGMPWYRVQDGLRALFNYDGALPQEYVDAGFGGVVDFRGYKYVVDFGGLPTQNIPQMYFMDFDQLSFLDLAQEICDVTSHELFVSLLPVIDHPASKFIYDYNQYVAATNPSQVITGIIRLDGIDKRVPPKYGAIKSYLDELLARGVEVENQDVGYELSNVTTDKFVVGAQEVEMYYFSNNKDRDNLELRKKTNGEPNNYELMQTDKWTLSASLKQQILPFYGFLGADKAVTIPRGFGSYQQIMLDSTGLDAYGVGNYYIATELELRAALVSYKQWVNFLIQYDEVYIQEMTENQTWESSLGGGIGAEVAGSLDGLGGTFKTDMQAMFAGRNFGVSVPRCVFNSDKNYMGSDGYPASPCAPPYGYPLYYKRAEKIGIPEGGIAAIQAAITTCMSNVARLTKKLDDNAPEFKLYEDDALEKVKKIEQTLADTKTIFNSIDDDDDPEQKAAATKYQEQIKLLDVELKKAQDYVEALDKVLDATNASDEWELQTVKSTLNGSAKLVKNISRLAKEHLENAKKVYAFVKGVAEENLGKKFLVKIPKACNVNYSTGITLYSPSQVGSISSGPFGFRPQPVSSQQGFVATMPFSTQFSDIYEHYLDHSYLGAYTYGALKGNFNPISEKWEFNYKPEPQGGFFNFALYDRNLSFGEAANVPHGNLPLASQQLLTPMDLTNILNGSNRVSCYARYDHSQNLDFTSVGADSIAQQQITANGFIPDVMEELDNLHPDKKMSMQQIQSKLADDRLLERQGPSVAYVKCDVSEELYMSPRIGEVSTKVWARGFKVKLSKPKMDIEYTIDSDGCKVPKVVKRRIQPSFAPANKYSMNVDNEDFVRFHDSNLKGEIVNSRVDHLDSNHVYALITLPGRIKSSVDCRYIDGPLAAFSTVKMYNLMTRDVVRGAPGFDKPASIVNNDQPLHVDSVTSFSFKDLGEARRLQQQAMKGASLKESKLSFISPSPVYPSMVAIPLMSMERCYGPWLSSTSLDPSTGSPGVMNIGGKIEFVKDENLAPWNFAGYQLMNDAGFLQAQFSNSLLLFSERGGFVFPQAPTGIGLAKALKNGGPLVTSISVSVGADKISTTVKMDLYTSSFGKLQKQKEGNIATISRERQKIIDQNNSAIRRGFGKSSSNANLFGGLLADGGSRIIAQARGTAEHFSIMEKGEAKRAEHLIGNREKHDFGVPVDGTKNKKEDGAIGAVGSAEDMGDDAAVTTNSFQLGVETWGLPLIGSDNGVLQWASLDPHDQGLPSSQMDKPDRV